MTDFCISIHKSKTDAEFWAAQLPYSGRTLIDVKGPFHGLLLEDHTAPHPADIASVEKKNCWMVLSEKKGA